MKIAVVGSGISGIVAAYLLSQKHEVKLYEKDSWVGGHTHTVRVMDGEIAHDIDTGFIVCNDKTYPNFLKFIKQLNVALQPTSMSFSVQDKINGLEYNGTSLNGFFAQRKNIINYKHYLFLRDIIKFNKIAKQFVSQKDYTVTLNELLLSNNIGDDCKRCYILPMISAIWSTPYREVDTMPAQFLCEFFDNHGMLDINNRPQWYSVLGGSYKYVQKFLEMFKGEVYKDLQVHKIFRKEDHVQLITSAGTEDFDVVVCATHSDQALELLANPNKEEINILGAIGYKSNDVILHTDTSLLPRSKRAWASWNYMLDSYNQGCCLTYNMNILQNLKSSNTYCVSLNQSGLIDKNKIIDRFAYSHPIFTPEATAAQKKINVISGADRIYYAGAYCGFGFHEDGVNSALRVVDKIDKELLCAMQFTTA